MYRRETMSAEGLTVDDAQLIADQTAVASAMAAAAAAASVPLLSNQPGAIPQAYPTLVGHPQVIPGQFPPLIHQQQPTMEQMAASSYQQAMAACIPTSVPAPNLRCYCQCVYNTGYPHSCALHPPLPPTQQFMTSPPPPSQPLLRPIIDSPGPSYLSPTMRQNPRFSIYTPSAPAQQQRIQFKRQLRESVYVTSSSSDDEELHVAETACVTGESSSRGSRKTLRVHSPPKATAGADRRTETIDLAGSSEDEDRASVSMARRLSRRRQIDTELQSAVQQTAESTQSPCRHAHCNCHSCTCLQCPMAAHCHHFHHHHHSAPLSCQLHSPCGCTNTQQPNNNSSTEFAPVRNNSQRPFHQHNLRSRNVGRPPVASVHPIQAQLRDSQNVQMERNRQAAARFIQSRQQQRQHQAAAAVAAQQNTTAYLSASPFLDWAGLASTNIAAAALAAAPGRFNAANHYPPQLLMVPAHAAPSHRNFVIQNPMPLEFNMGVVPTLVQGPILVQAEGLVFNNPSAVEPQPVGASVEQIDKCTHIYDYAKTPTGDEERCTVCLADFETGESIRSLQCTHLFHRDCIDRWLVYNKKCPVCRIDMDKSSGGGNNKQHSSGRLASTS